MKKYLIVLFMSCACFAGISHAACKSSVNLSDINALLDQKAYKEAEPKLLRVIKDCPESPLALSYLADVYKMQGNASDEATTRGKLKYVQDEASKARTRRTWWIIFACLGLVGIVGVSLWAYSQYQKGNARYNRKSELYSQVVDLRGKLEDQLTRLRLVGTDRRLLEDVQKGHAMCLEIIDIGVNDLDDLDTTDTLAFIADCESILEICHEVT